MQIVVIGALGFLGQHLVHQLLIDKNINSEIQIKCIDKIASLEKIKLIYSKDFTDNRIKLFLDVNIIDYPNLYEILENTDIIFYLAAVIAYGRKNKEILYNNNIKGIEKVVKCAKSGRVKKVVYVSSFATIGCHDNKDKNILATENVENNWDKEKFCYYASSKHYGEQSAINLAGQDMDVHIAVPGIMIGPGPTRYAGLLPFQIALQKKWTLVPTGGSNFVDVRDVANGLIKLSKQKKAYSKYLFVAHNLEHAELLRHIATRVNRKLYIIKIPKIVGRLFFSFLSFLEWFLPVHSVWSKEGVVKAFQFRYFCHQKTTDDLAWSPAYSLEETLQDTLEWLDQEKFINLHE